MPSADHMQVICTSLQTDKQASTSSLKFIAGQTLLLLPNQLCQSTLEYLQILSNVLLMGLKTYIKIVKHVIKEYSAIRFKVGFCWVLLPVL